MTKLEIIKETADYYSEDPSRRGVVYFEDLGKMHQGTCSYLTEDGKMCAVGRICMNPEDFQMRTDGMSVETLYEEDMELDNYIKPEYRGYDITFWMDLQEFHDRAINWNDKGLTEIGHIHLNQLLERYKEN